MTFLISNSSDSWENLIFEKKLLEDFDGDYILLYQNDDSIIIGKNQVFQREINNLYVASEKIPIYRRFSGGGTVYHDMGNINICIVCNNSGFKTKVSEYKSKLCKKIKDIFKINIVLQGNDLMVEDKKISGSAEYHQRSRSLHHFTLLICSNLTKIRHSLINDNYNCYKTKAQFSVPKQIANLQDFSSKRLKVNNIYDLLIDGIKLSRINLNLIKGSLENCQLKHEFKEEMLNNGPYYTFSNYLNVDSYKAIHIEFNVSNGIICNFNKQSIDYFGVDLNGKQHRFEDLYKSIKKKDLIEFLI